MEFPAPHVVAARHHPGPDPLGDPGFDHEVADLRLDPHELPGLDSHPSGVGRMNPERVGMGDFVKPLGVRAAGMDLHREPERGDEEHLVRGEVLGVNMALYIGRDRELGPSPVGQGGRVELEPAGRRGKAPQDFPLDLHPDRPASVGIRLGASGGHDIGARGGRRLRVDPAGPADADVVQFAWGNAFLVDRPDPLGDLKRPVPAHVL